MQIQELSIDPITHNDELNPAIWQDYKLRTDVRSKLLQIAEHFKDYLNVPDLKLTDITVSGSNAGYNYSDYSDIDLHLIVQTDGSQEDLFTAKKNQYNFTHDIKIRGIPVELYVQPADQTHHSAGIYSVLRNKWISEPDATAPSVNPQDVRSKARNYSSMINKAMRSQSLDKCRETWADLRRLRKAGLEAGGEQSIENLAYKLLRARGQIDKLIKYMDKLQSAELSLKERT